MRAKQFFVVGKYLLGLAFFIFIPLSVQAAGFSRVEYENRQDGKWYLTTQTLTKNKSPYLIDGGCIRAEIPIYATVTIEAGVVVKFEQEKYCGLTGVQTSLTVSGNLYVNGTENEPVIFTSMYDDSAGGDSNEDGTATSPSPGNWRYLSFYPGQDNVIDINYSVFKYGGGRYAELIFNNVNNALNLTLNSIEVAYSGVYGIQTAMPINISNSKFHHNAAGAIYGDLYWNPQINAINNWWGDDSGPTTPSNPSGKGEKIYGNVLFDPWVGKIINSAPVLELIDGSNGVSKSVTYLPDQPVFKIQYLDADSNAPAFVNVVIDSTVYPMVLDSSLVYNFTPPTGTLQKGDHSYYFETSDGEQYTRLPSSAEPNFTFKILNRPVILIPGILGSEQKNGEWVLDPILHTYDNLMDTFRANGYEDNKDLFSFPYQWRQSNILTAVQMKHKIDEVKQSSGSDKVNLVAHSMGGLVARQYVQSDSYENDVEQLIFMGTPHLGAPKAYLMWEGGEFPNSLVDNFIKLLLKIEAFKLDLSLFNYIQQGNAESLQQLLPIYSYIFDNKTKEALIYPNKYPVNIFLESLNSSAGLLLDSDVKITNIVGKQSKDETVANFFVTSSQILPLWKDGYPVDFYNTELGVVVGSGDKTVPLESGSAVNKDIIEVDSEHRMIPSKSSKYVLSKITGFLNPTIINDYKIMNISNLLIIKILSPADIIIIAPDGKRVGKDFDSNSEINEIDGAFYSGFETDDEYITIPDPIDGEYKIETKGTGNGGKYTLVSGFVGETTSTSRDFVGYILPDQITSVSLNYSSNTNNIINIQPTDLNPPQININSPSSTDYLRSNLVNINVEIKDDETGVLSQEIKLDDTIIENSTTIDFFGKKLGEHVLFVSSTDFQGNKSFASTTFWVIATVSSTISDINRIFDLGWISDKRIKNELILRLKMISRFEKKIAWVEERLLNNKKIMKRVEKIIERVDKILGKQFLHELGIQFKKNNINKQAFDILKEDVEWLINN